MAKINLVPERRKGCIDCAAACCCPLAKTANCFGLSFALVFPLVMYTLPGIEKLSIDQPDVHCKNSFTGQRGNELYKKIVQNSDWRYRRKRSWGEMLTN